MPESGELLMEYKSMIPAPGITMIAVARSCSGSQNIFQRFTIKKFAQSDLVMDQFTQRQALFAFFLCFSSFSFVVS